MEKNLIIFISTEHEEESVVRRNFASIFFLQKISISKFRL